MTKEQLLAVLQDVFEELEKKPTGDSIKYPRHSLNYIYRMLRSVEHSDEYLVTLQKSLVMLCESMDEQFDMLIKLHEYKPFQVKI